MYRAQGPHRHAWGPDLLSGPAHTRLGPRALRSLFIIYLVCVYLRSMHPMYAAIDKY